MHDLSRLLINHGQHGKAVAEALQGIARLPSPELLWLAGLGNNRRGKHDQAVAFAEMASALGCVGNGAGDVATANGHFDIHAWY